MIISKTPLRASFFGGGTDFSTYYENSKLGYGTVVSTALDMYVYIIVNRKFDDNIRIVYSGNELVSRVDEVKHNIIREAMKIVGIEKGIEIIYMADIPLSNAGIGLASSSALAVGVLNALHAYKGDLDNSKQIMDYDTGGAEFLLSLNHPYDKTAVTEGYKPNVELCKRRLLPLGINFKECSNPKNIPFEDEMFDLMINRHGEFEQDEIYRLLKKDGIFITEQVGENNERDLVKMVLPDIPKPFPNMNLTVQRKKFEEAGFKIIRAEETYRPITFYDIGAFV